MSEVKLILYQNKKHRELIVQLFKHILEPLFTESRQNFKGEITLRLLEQGFTEDEIRIILHVSRRNIRYCKIKLQDIIDEYQEELEK